MKKSIILFITFVTFSCISFAQKSKSTSSKNNIEYGFLSGVNFNSIRKKNLNTFIKENAKNYTGQSVGGYFKLNISRQFGIKALIQYDQNGYKLGTFTFEDLNGMGLTIASVTIKNNYINLPIVGEYTFGNKIKYYINAGPYFGFLIVSNITLKTASTTASTVKEKSDAYKNTNFGLSFSGGTLIPISKKMQLHFCLKNNYGLSNIIKPISSDNSSFKTNAFSILAGINIAS